MVIDAINVIAFLLWVIAVLIMWCVLKLGRIATALEQIAKWSMQIEFNE